MLIASIIVILIIISFLIYFGAFQKINIKKSKTSPMTLAYESISGAYTKSGSVMDKIYYDLLSADIKTTKGFGVYLEDPKTVKEPNLRSIAGDIIENIDGKEIPSNIKTTKINSIEVLETSFPYRNKTSVMFSLMKVYPALEKYRKSNNLPFLPVMEIYDIPNKEIKYFVPLKSEDIKVFENLYQAK